MLSRHAENLFWIGRYVERAETLARLLGVGARNALLPNTSGGFRNEWEPILQASGTRPGFDDKYGDVVERNVESYLVFDTDNPSSIASCFERARENGRIVRTSLTGQTWDALNGAHREMLELKRTERSKLSTGDLIDWTIRQASMIRGTIGDTQLRNDGFDFMNLGTYLERSDATARILDVKYFVLLPQIADVGSGLDNYQWRTILRALSATRAFNFAYGGEVTAAKIADFLIFNRQAPRSLSTCADSVSNHLDHLARQYGNVTSAQEAAQTWRTQLRAGNVEAVFDTGLHEFLTDAINTTAALTGTIQDTYLRGEARP
ncbi:MAG: alpha-E domain-containing protein [Pseudomonadota bacterium]